MDIRENLLEDKHFLLQALAGLVTIERDRIISTGLARESQLNSLADVMEYLTKLGKKYPKSNIPLNTMANLCTVLKSVVLPGDFENCTFGGADGVMGDESGFYIALDLPYEGEQFYDLSSVLKKDKGEDKDKDEECPECEEEEEGKEDDADDTCYCTACSSDQANKVLVASVGKYLKKVSEVCGKSGRHDAAYLIEKTIRSMIRKVLKQ
jgi:hypothetical protein